MSRREFEARSPALLAVVRRSGDGAVVPREQPLCELPLGSLCGWRCGGCEVDYALVADPPNRAIHAELHTLLATHSGERLQPAAPMALCLAGVGVPGMHQFGRVHGFVVLSLEIAHR